VAEELTLTVDDVDNERMEDALREDECEVLAHLVAVGDAEGERVTDTEVEEVLVKGWVVPMAERVELGIRVRVAPDWLAPSPSEPLGDTLTELVTLVDEEALGDAEPDALRH
jgi:hypothetical protein